MIRKDLFYKNKYLIDENGVGVEELKMILLKYLQAHDFHSIICNAETCKQLNINPGDSFVTINNKVEDGAFYVNGVY